MSATSEGAAKKQRDLITPIVVEVEYLIPEKTQSVWRHHNRYGFRDLAIKLGRRVVYDRADIDAWLESRKGRGEVSV